MSTSDQITQLSEAVKEFTDQTRAEYGATKKLIEDARDKAEADTAELRDKMSQAHAELATKEEVRATVLELQQKQVEFERQAKPVPEFDTQVLKSADDLTPAQCKSAVEGLLTTESKDTDIKRLQELHDELLMIKAVMEPPGSRWDSDKMHRQGGFGDYQWDKDANPLVRGKWNEYHRLWSKYASDDFRAKAYDTTELNSAGWLPTILSSNLMKFLEVKGAVIPLFRSFPLPSATWKNPITTAVDQAVLETEGTTATTAVAHDTQAGAPTLNSVTFDVIKLRASKEIFLDAIQDSVVAMVPLMMEEMGDAIRRGIEDAIINGDHDSSGTDADNITSTHARRSWEGLRAIAEENSKTLLIGSSFAVADVYAAKKGMGRYGINPSDCAWICGVRSLFDLMGLSDLTTYSTFNTGATLITGSLASVLGSKVVVSEYIREDVADTGLMATTTDTDTIIICVHTPSWWLGNWRGITLQRDPVIAKDSEFVYARWRGDFQKMRASTETTEVVIAGLDA